MVGLTLTIKEPSNCPQRLGAAGLSLHYANIINQMDNIVSLNQSLLQYLFHFLGDGFMKKWMLIFEWKFMCC